MMSTYSTRLGARCTAPPSCRAAPMRWVAPRKFDGGMRSLPGSAATFAGDGPAYVTTVVVLHSRPHTHEEPRDPLVPEPAALSWRTSFGRGSQTRGVSRSSTATTSMSTSRGCCSSPSGSIARRTSCDPEMRSFPAVWTSASRRLKPSTRRPSESCSVTALGWPTTCSWWRAEPRPRLKRPRGCVAADGTSASLTSTRLKARRRWVAPRSG